MPSTSRLLAQVTKVKIDEQNPLALLREYSNHDKHRALRIMAGKTLVQTDTEWRDSVTGGMRPFEVGTVLRTVGKGIPTMTEFSPALLVERPNGQWVAIGPELNGIARCISDIVIPHSRHRHGAPGRAPGQHRPGRHRALHRGTRGGRNNVRAHERAQPVMAAALGEALQTTFKWPETIDLPDEEDRAE